MTNEEIKGRVGFYWFKPIENHPNVLNSEKWYLVEYHIGNNIHYLNFLQIDGDYGYKYFSPRLEKYIGTFVYISHPDD